MVNSQTLCIITPFTPGIKVVHIDPIQCHMFEYVVYNYLLLRDDFRIGLVISPRAAIIT
jgi:hypothetical protein